MVRWRLEHPGADAGFLQRRANLPEPGLLNVALLEMGKSLGALSQEGVGNGQLAVQELFLFGAQEHRPRVEGLFREIDQSVES